MASKVADFGLSRELDDSEDNPDSVYQTQVTQRAVVYSFTFEIIRVIYQHFLFVRVERFLFVGRRLKLLDIASFLGRVTYGALGF